MQVERIKKMVGIFILFVGIFTFLGGNYLWQEWVKNGPTEMNESAGVIYPYNDHGRIVYFDLRQRIIYYGLPIILFGVGGMIWLFSSRFLDRKKQNLDRKKQNIDR